MDTSKIKEECAVVPLLNEGVAAALLFGLWIVVWVILPADRLEMLLTMARG